MIRKVLLAYDVHLDTKVPKEYNLFKKFVKDFKPDEIIIGGDYMDVSALSAWDYDKKRKMEGRRYIKEYELANKELDYLQKYTKKVVYLEGNHPYHKDTEVLTEDGWVNIRNKNLLQKKVAQFDLNFPQINYDYPLGRQEVYTSKIITIENNYTKQIVDPRHKVVYDNEKVSAGELLGQELDKNKFMYAGYLNDFKNKYTFDDLRLLTWIIMDGCLVFRNKNSHHIQFKLSKKRKIDALENLLNKMNIKYTIKKSKKTGGNKLQPYVIRIYSESKKYFELLNNKKEFPLDFSKLNIMDAKVVIDTIEHTDGHRHHNQIIWTTISQHNLDVIMQMCLVNGMLFNYKINKSKSGFKNGKPQFTARITKDANKNSLTKIKTSISEYNDLCYCLTMPKGTLITRIHGKVSFSGNCDRVNRYIDKNPEMEGIIEVPIVLNLKKRGIEWIKMNKYYKLGHIYFTHGLYTNEFHAKKTLQNVGKNIVTGHLHTSQTYMMNMMFQKPIMAYSMPCLCNKSPDYLKNRPANWMSGFGVLYVDTKTGYFNLYTVNIINNRFIWNGKEYK